MGKASAESFKPHEVEAMARQQNRMNNPNVSNVFGSTTTEFGDDDQAQITQSLSPEMQGIIDSQMDFVGQGPAQMGQYSNPFLSQMMQGAADNIQRRWGGNPSSDAGAMGGYASTFPQFSQGQASQPSAPIDPVGPQPQPSGGGGGIGNTDYTQMPGAGGGLGGMFQSGLNARGGFVGDMSDIPSPDLQMGNKMASGRSQKGMGNVSFGVNQDNPNMQTLEKAARQSIGDRLGMSQNAQANAAELGKMLSQIKWGNS